MKKKQIIIYICIPVLIITILLLLNTRDSYNFFNLLKLLIFNNSSTPSYIPKKSGKFVSKGENICCQAMEQMYGVSFTSERPNWLVNPMTGAKLELDCYNENLKIAVEYNGIQHYKWPNFTNQTYEQYLNQIYRDNIKKKLCKQYGVRLIIVPYTVPHNQIPSFIMTQLNYI